MNAENEEPLPEDATHVEQALFEGQRGALLNGLTIRFEAHATEEQWRQLIKVLRFEDSTVGDLRVATFVALPRKQELLLPYLIGEVTLRADQPGTATWAFEWARAPDASPPDDMVARSAAVGGFPMILERLGTLWPASAPVEAEVSATYLVEISDWSVRLPSRAGGKLQRDGQQFRIVPTHWQVEPASGPVQEIITSRPEAGALFLTGKGAYTLRWTPRFLNEVDGAVWGGLKNFLEPR
jgi:hypothetical protein